jgi:hypothetical protein
VLHILSLCLSGLFWHCFLRSRDYRFEAFRLMNGHIGQNFTIERNASQSQAMHEFAVGEAFHTHSGVDTLRHIGQLYPPLAWQRGKYSCDGRNNPLRPLKLFYDEHER